jgi:hypothetical protein
MSIFVDNVCKTYPNSGAYTHFILYLSKSMHQQILCFNSLNRVIDERKQN